jgi:uncharacterized membrane protein
MAKTAPEESSRFALDPSLLGKALVVGTLVCALVVGIAAGVASSLLVFVTGALLGAILLVWHSLRTLAGDTEVDDALLDAVPLDAHGSLLADEKRQALRALKDLEQEHVIGKLDDADYAELDAEYRARAKDVIHQLDDELAPYRAKAEALVRAHLEKRAASRAENVAATDAKPACPSCETPNDPDAAFCKKCGAKLTSES